MIRILQDVQDNNLKERAKSDMNENTIYSDAPNDIGEILKNGKRIDDFLPPPDQLQKRVPKVKVTIALSQQSVEFFKKAVKKNNLKYQTMINEVLDKYVEKYSDII